MYNLKDYICIWKTLFINDNERIFEEVLKIYNGEPEVDMYVDI